jgi:transcriptional regulator with XRE-family HTH domain
LVNSTALLPVVNYDVRATLQEEQVEQSEELDRRGARELLERLAPHLSEDVVSAVRDLLEAAEQFDDVAVDDLADQVIAELTDEIPLEMFSATERLVGWARHRVAAVPQTTRRLTPNQLVAYNLRRARELRGWTQTEAAQRLEPYLGTTWSVPTFSVAENSYTSTKRVRHFDADAIVALAEVFDLPIGWFFTPPEPDRDDAHLIEVAAAEGGVTVLAHELLSLILTDAATDRNDALQQRVKVLIDNLPNAWRPDVSEGSGELAKIGRELKPLLEQLLHQLPET